MKVSYRELSFSAHRVQIKIEGFRIDKLLDKAMKQGLDLRDVRFDSQLSATLWITPEDLKALRKLARSLYRITEIQQRGAGYRIKNFLRTPMQVIGLLMVTALVISQSFFVKTIDVSGYKAIPESELRKALAEADVREGAYRPSIDWEKAEEHLYDTFPQITWLSLVYDGRKVFLTIAETGEIESIQEESKAYSNITASESGYVEDISTYRGLALVEEGDYVQKGQVLISGYVPTQPSVYDENWPKFFYVKSSGTVTAKVPYRLTFNQERYIRSGGEDEKIVVNKREKTEEEIKEKVNQQIRRWAKENLPENAEILSKSLNFSYKESIIEIGVTLEVRQQIGEEQEIVIGQESTD